MAEVERNLFAWLWRRVEHASDIGVIRFYIAAFKRMWADEFGTDTPIPQEYKDRVNERIKTIREAE